MSYGFNSVDDISRAICHSGGMKDKYGTPMCDVNAKIIYDHIKSLEEKKCPKGWYMVEAEGNLKVARDLMKVSEERCNLRKENEKLKATLQKIHDVANPPVFNHQKPKEVKDHVNDVLPKVEHLRKCFSECAHECRDHELNSISRSIVETNRKDWIEKEEKYRNEIKKLQQQIGVIQRMNKRLRKEQ